MTITDNALTQKSITLNKLMKSEPQIEFISIAFKRLLQNFVNF